jgi:hypothetical protein
LHPWPPLIIRAEKSSKCLEYLAIHTLDVTLHVLLTHAVIQELSAVCIELADLMQDCPQQWLLSAMDFTGYAAEDEAVRQLFDR